MTYQPLHHKYRPQTFGQLVGQPAIAATLSQAIATAKIAPAYLFAGPRGTGKTSSARIFAKSLNCLASPAPTPDPCGICESCRAIAASAALDVIELDAASNTGVDNIRELIERAQFAPVQCRYKLYLIDEVHMLSTAAFNALLKTLEEPPPRVVFVLATTDPQRVLPTIISRCQRFDFRRIPLPDLTAHLQEIARLEKIDLTAGAIAQVAQLANGGLRDAESLLDQLGLLPGKIDVDRVWDLVGSIPEGDLLALVQSLRAGDTIATLTKARQLLDRGREPLTLLQSLAGFFRDLLVAQAAPERGDLVVLTAPVWEQLCAEACYWERDRILAAQKSLKESELQVKNAAQPRLWLEIALLTLGTASTNAAAISGVVPPPKADAIAASPVAGARQATRPDPRSAVDTAPIISPVAPTATPPAEPTPVAAIPTPTIPIPTDPPTKLPKAAEEATGARQATPAPEAIAAERSADAEPLNLQPLWRQVMEQLPPATKALVGQHCRLLALDGTVAFVGVRNANLLRLAESKQANLEIAFTAVCQQETRVRLEVAPTDFAPSDPLASTSPSDPLPDSPSLTTPAVPPTSQPSIAPAATPERDRQPTKPAKSSRPAAASRTQKAKSPAATPPALKTTDVPEDLREAVRALAEDFNGEPIDLSDRSDWQEAPPPTAATNQSNLIADSPDEPDGEVPFARHPPTGEPWDIWEVAVHQPGTRPGDRDTTAGLN